MKKLMITLLGLGLIAAAFAGYALFILTQGAPIEYQNKGNGPLIENIDQQLSGYDLSQLEKKSSLIYEKSIEALQASVDKKQLTYEDITAYYLNRIKLYDQTEEGFNSMMAINPQAMALAKLCDANHTEGHSPLFGMPITLKDNINTNFLPTTAGALALENFTPKENAPIVNGLIGQGAIILGKSNMSQFANFMDMSMPNGYTDLKGQNLNPYGKLTLSTLGSSSGSATNVTANFSALSIGTETTGSIIAPASIQGIAAMRPSLGKVSGEGIIPLSHSLDTAGPMGKTIADITLLYNGISSDQVSLDKDVLPSLQGKTFAMRTLDKDSESADKIEALLKKAGAKILFVDVDESSINNIDILVSEFNKDLNTYLVDYEAPFSSLEAIVAYNKEDLDHRAKYGQGLLEMSVKGNTLTEEATKEKMQLAQDQLLEILNQSDALIYPDGDGVLLSCMAGAPEVTLPLYVDTQGQPHGLTLVTKPNEDALALQYAKVLENLIKGRVAPDITTP